MASVLAMQWALTSAMYAIAQCERILKEYSHDAIATVIFVATNGLYGFHCKCSHGAIATMTNPIQPIAVVIAPCEWALTILHPAILTLEKRTDEPGADTASRHELSERHLQEEHRDPTEYAANEVRNQEGSCKDKTKKTMKTLISNSHPSFQVVEKTSTSEKKTRNF